MFHRAASVILACAPLFISIKSLAHTDPFKNGTTAPVSTSKIHAEGDACPMAFRRFLKSVLPVSGEEARASGYFMSRWPSAKTDRAKPGFTFEPLRGTRVDPEKKILGWEIPDARAAYFELGAGKNGTVYRIEPLSGAPFIFKHYKHDSMVQNDLAGFEFIGERLFDLATGVRSMRPTASGNWSMKILDVRGRNLGSFFDPSLPVSQRLPLRERQQLTEDWNDFVRQMEKSVEGDSRIEAITRGLKDDLRTLRFRFREGERVFDLYLKPDNAVVESGTGQIYVVDPF